MPYCVLCSIVLCCAVRCGAVQCGAVLCCAVLCSDFLCCVVLCSQLTLSFYTVLLIHFNAPFLLVLTETSLILATVLLGDVIQAKKAINSLNNQSFHNCVVGVSFAPPDALLFVGNLPFEFTKEEFRELMSPFGPIERLFLVHSEQTGKSKGYGFVEYLNRDCASQAKQALMASGSKYVGGRILRIDFAETNLISYDDLHSKTLFVDRLPRNFTSGEKLEELFGQSGTVMFAQVTRE